MGYDPTSLKDLVDFMARALVDSPDDVEVNEVVGEQTTVVELSVSKDDLGKVIGKQGRTAKSMRTILNAASTKLQKRSVLEIVEQTFLVKYFVKIEAVRLAFFLPSQCLFEPKSATNFLVAFQDTIHIY